MTQQIIFQREVLIDAPLTHVWQLVATEEGLRQWWGNTIFFEAKEGGRCEEWRLGRERTSHWQGVVTVYAPPSQLMLTLRVQEPEEDAPELTTISIALEAIGEQTNVHVTHRAFGPTAAVGTEEERERVKQPIKPQEVPMAQLDRPAPGTLPQPSVAPPPMTGRIEPAYFLLSKQQSDALTLTWQRRLTSLAAAVTQIDAA
jgi:uncharacterized protein YndB with AHSA1/START domain